MIGSFGNIIFKSNSEKQILFQNLTSSEKANWTKHEANSIKSKSEFLRDESKEYKFSMILRAMNKISPTKELEKIRNIKENGLVETLVLGGKLLGKYYISSMNVIYDYIDNKGKVWDIKVDINLSEYSEETFQESNSTKNTHKDIEKRKTINYETGEVN